jgi:nucleotide-binding universal stress UspA family protein
VEVVTRILACVDVSVYAESVVDHAAFAASRLGGSIELLHVIGRKERGELYDVGGVLGPDAGAALHAQILEADALSARLAADRGRALLDAMKKRAESLGVPSVSTTLREGSLVDTVVELEAESELVVIGKRGANADFAHLHLGSALERVVRASIRPVLVASRVFHGVTRVLIADDGGPSATRAIDALATSPLIDGLAVSIVTVGHDGPDTRARLGAASERLADRASSVEVRLLDGDPEATIIEEVHRSHADLVVMGAYGHSRVRHLVVGSTTSAVIRGCLVPILLFR